MEECKLDPMSTTEPVALVVRTEANYFEPISFRITFRDSPAYVDSGNTGTRTCGSEAGKVVYYL